MGDLREKRLANEWAYLLSLAEANPERLYIIARTREGAGERFRFELKRTPAYTARPIGCYIRDSHTITLLFPEFYPAVPCEAFLKETVFHPNVHPMNGFICLWDQSSPGDSVIEAVQQIQRVVTWNLYNPSPEHVMQADALACAFGIPPLEFERMKVPEELARERYFRQSARPAKPKRLSDCSG